jgi:hypothetical protein
MNYGAAPFFSTFLSQEVEADMTKSEEEIARMRELADYQSKNGSDQDVFTWAQIAGTTLSGSDIERFLGIVHDFSGNPFRQEAMMIFIRLAIHSGDFNKARQGAAILCNLEHFIFHALSRLRIARFS